jgi:hypothetical protein
MAVYAALFYIINVAERKKQPLSRVNMDERNKYSRYGMGYAVCLLWCRPI